MIIPNNELKQYFFGAVRFEESEGFLFPRRFTEKQSEYTLHDENLTVKAKCSAGVTIEFETDAERISFDTLLLNSSRFYYSVDIWVDGSLAFAFSEANVPFGTQKRVDFSMKKGVKKVAIYLPCLFETGIANFEADGELKPVEKGEKILFLGDSITQGYVAKFTSLCYVSVLARRLGADALNQAIAGDVFDANNIDAELGFLPEKIFVAYGTNDWSLDCDIKTSSRAFLERLTEVYPSAEIYLILPIYRTDIDDEYNKCRPPFREYTGELKAVAESFSGVKVIDGWELVPHIPKLFDDGLHPNDLGFSFYTDALMENI